MGIPERFVKRHYKQVDLSSFCQKRNSISSGAFTVDLGAVYNNFKIWLDEGSSDVHVRLNPEGTETAASASFPKISDLDLYEKSLKYGISTLYFYGLGTTGAVNVEAW